MYKSISANKKMKMKNYTLSWFSPLEGKINLKRQVATCNPKHALLDFACEMILTAGNILGGLKHDSIMQNIQTGKTSRKHYFIEFDNNEVLSIMEEITNNK